MNQPYDANTQEDLELRLRKDAGTHRRSPSPALRDRILTAVRRQRACSNNHVIVRRPFIALRRVLAAAAMILVVVLAAIVLQQPNSGHIPGGSPTLADRGQPLATDDGPQLVQPLLELAPRFALDAQSPWEAEADRMLADARHASRIIMDNLPFRGRAAEASERRDF